MATVTPMMQQYLRIKSDYKDAFLFFRLGDFYEMFYEDAVQASQELEITLTKRDASQENPIPMCGVPYHAAESYIKILVDRGYKVAICEQTEDPKQAKGVVKREVIQLITPGTVMDESMLKETELNYLSSLSVFDDAFVLVSHELSTGETNLVMIQDFETVIHELAKQATKELVISSKLEGTFVEALKDQLQITFSYEDSTNFIGEFRELYEDLPDERYMTAFSRMLNYIQHTQKRPIHHFQKPEIIELNRYLSLDMYAKRNLELTETLIRKQTYGSLLWVLSKTVTAMGARTLKKWLERPLLNKREIERRLEVVEALLQDFIHREELREALTKVYDLERLAGRISFGNVNARDLIQLKQSLMAVPSIKKVLQEMDHPVMNELNDRLVYPKSLVALLERGIKDEPPIAITEGNVIKDGYNDQLDTYRSALTDGKQWILNLEQKERETTGIKSLKVGYNRVFGYYIEVRHANRDLVPEDRYERKQTLANAERFITPELKEREALILEAEEKSIDLEYQLFIEIREQLKESIASIQALAQTVSELDCLQSFSQVSEENDYHRPTFYEDSIRITNGRHPVVEKVMEKEYYVPNDIYLDNDASILLITGPNMSGKSTYMRQLALTIIMGQIGCFVPADEAQLTIVDQIFTRIGAADDLVSGQSTFMVEMLEANHALRHATKNSLILFDEIGRGTSTYDGMALAHAIIEHIHDHIGAKTLFSTHYHELTDLEDKLTHVKNISVRAEEYDDKIVFLHKVEPGRANESYGIHVAKLADMPENLINRAQKILHTLEEKAAEPQETTQGQLTFFEAEPPVTETQATAALNQEESVIQSIKALELYDMTPMEAMQFLHGIYKQLKHK